MQEGEAIAIDYFQTAFSKNHRFKTFFEMKAGSNIYENPGCEDITHCPDATTYVEEAEQAGLVCEYYNTQNTLSVEGFPPELLSPQDIKDFEKFDSFGSSQFMVVVLTNSDHKENTIDRNRLTGHHWPVSYAELDKLPPIYIVDKKTNKVDINLTEEEISILNQYHVNAEYELTEIIAGRGIDSNFIHVKNVIPIFNKVKSKTILLDNEKDLLLQFVVQSRLRNYPARRDIIASHLTFATGLQWDLRPPFAYAKYDIQEASRIPEILESLKKFNLTNVNKLVHPNRPDDIVLRINEMNLEALWNTLYPQPKLACAIRSPITAAGDAHAELMDSIKKKIDKNKSEFEPFLKALDNKDYARALRIICTATSSLAYDVTEIFVRKCHEKGIKFDMNATAGTEKYSALHQAARKNNQRLYDLLIQYGADQTLLDANGLSPQRLLQKHPSMLKTA